jgi:hypothetical protein
VEVLKWDKYKQKHWAEIAFDEYCFNNTRYRQLGKKYGKCTRSIRCGFDKLYINYFLEPPKDKHLNLMFDGTYFGRSLCYFLFKIKGKTIYFKQCSETIANIALCLKTIEAQDHTFKSFTLDGKKGVISY